MRQLGAAALRALVEIDLDRLGPEMVDKLVSLSYAPRPTLPDILTKLSDLWPNLSDLPSKDDGLKLDSRHPTRPRADRSVVRRPCRSSPQRPAIQGESPKIESFL